MYALSLCFNITLFWTFIPDGCTVINNVFPLWAIKYFHSGSLGWSAELKGASTLVVWKDGGYLTPRISHPV